MLRPAAACGAALLSFATAQALAQSSSDAGPAPAGPRGQPSLSIELNKLEMAENACRGYFVVTNRTAAPVKEIRIDVFLFDRRDVILRRVAFSFVDVRAGRTKVVPFDMAEVSCTEIGRLLVSDVLACSAPSGAPLDACAETLAVSTRAEVKFEY